MQMKGIQLLIQCLLLSTAQCDFHSLEFLSTGRVHPADGPQFEQLTVLDKVPISYCDSLTKREVLEPTLETQNLPEDCEEAYYNMLDSLNEIPQFINSTVYVQRRRGCIQSADGTVSAFEDWAVNGLDFLSFDPESQRWTSHSPSAVTVKLRWNKNNARNFAIRHFIRELCPLLIQKVTLKPTQQHTDGNSVDGRDLRNTSDVRWKILTTMFGMCSLMLAVTAVTCMTICLLKYVKRKPRPPAKVDPQLIEQFTRMLVSVSSPDLLNISDSYTQNARREWDQWGFSIMRQDQNVFDPEFFADKINGSYQ